MDEVSRKKRQHPVNKSGLDLPGSKKGKEYPDRSVSLRETQRDEILQDFKLKNNRILVEDTIIVTKHV